MVRVPLGSEMPTPVEISFIKMRDDLGFHVRGIEGLGGIFRDRPWYMSERNLIAEVEKPEATRAWNFYLRNGGEAVPLIIAVRDGRKYLTTPGENGASAKLAALPPVPSDFAEPCR
jgi:hypothetical protein